MLAMLAAVLGFLLVPGGAAEPAAADHGNCFNLGCGPVPYPLPHDIVCLPSPDPHKEQTCIL